MSDKDNQFNSKRIFLFGETYAIKCFFRCIENLSMPLGLIFILLKETGLKELHFKLNILSFTSLEKCIKESDTVIIFVTEPLRIKCNEIANLCLQLNIRHISTDFFAANRSSPQIESFSNNKKVLLVASNQTVQVSCWEFLICKIFDELQTNYWLFPSDDFIVTNNIIDAIIGRTDNRQNTRKCNDVMPIEVHTVCFEQTTENEFRQVINKFCPKLVIWISHYNTQSPISIRSFFKSNYNISNLFLAYNDDILFLDETNSKNVVSLDNKSFKPNFNSELIWHNEKLFDAIKNVLCEIFSL